MEENAAVFSLTLSKRSSLSYRNQSIDFAEQIGLYFGHKSPTHSNFTYKNKTDKKNSY